jgi:hypothetical protein
MDEKDFNISNKPGEVITGKGIKTVDEVTSTEKGNL